MAPLRLADSNPVDELWKDWSRFVPRLSRGDRGLLDELPRGTIAKPLLQAKSDAQLVLDARSESSRRVILEPEAWRNERGRAERHSEFNAMGGVSLAGELDPATLRTAGAAALIQYAELFVLAEEERGSDAVGCHPMSRVDMDRPVGKGSCDSPKLGSVWSNAGATRLVATGESRFWLESRST